MTEERILLIIGGGIAAYKCLDLIRRLRERGYGVRVVMTKAAQEFVTPLSAGALTNDRVFTDLFNLDDEQEIGHIRLSRDAGVIVVAPATADLLAKMAGGHANDLATSVLLATDKPVLVAPAMNPRMWLNPATQRNVAQLQADGIHFVGPEIGEMAERGEAGRGRLAEVPELVAAIENILGGTSQSVLQAAPSASSNGKVPAEYRPLSGCRVLITAGPTHEPIDPVRYIANRSSGKQGYAIAAAAARLGADVTLVSGPVVLADPDGVRVLRVVTAMEMLEAVKAAMPADIAVFTAAVADWRVAKPKAEKIKKTARKEPAKLKLVENPDILKSIGTLKAGRPHLVIGFAAETESVLKNAKKKLKSKGADWIIANDVSPETGIMGGDRNSVHLISSDGVSAWPDMTKQKVAERLVTEAAAFLARHRLAAE